MGTLAFHSLDIQVLASRTALVFGAWQLTRADDALHGLFTLVFKRYPEGWRIVHDHTSSAAP
jgi:ketosteroid isomerase-like protein